MIKEEKDKSSLLSVANFACSCEAEDAISDIFYKHKQDSPFIFYELYFIHPYTKQWPQNNLKLPAIAPYLRSVINKYFLTIPTANLKPSDLLNINSINWVTRNSESIQSFEKDYEFSDINKSLIIGRALLDCWKQYSPSNNKYYFEEATNPLTTIKMFLHYWPKGELGLNNDEYPRFNLKYKFSVDYFRNNYPLDTYNAPISDNDKITRLKEYLILFYPWSKCSDSSAIYCLALPIATFDIFYGYILIFYSAGYEENISKISDLEKDIIKSLSHTIYDVYLPNAQIIHNRWLENLVYHELDKDKCIFTKNEIELNDIKVHIPFLDVKKSAFSNIIEKAFCDLWVWRITLLNVAHNNDKVKKEEKVGDIIESLIFKDYIIGSRQMMKIISNIAGVSDNLRKTSESLPSILIVGGSGSGKEKIPYIIKCLSPSYREFPIITLNMGLLKPKEIISALLSGVNLQGPKNDKSQSIEFDGIFEKIYLMHKKAIIVLDELNSLDIESQGGLLRLLEKGEIAPLGGIKPIYHKDMDFLIIGVMNELPEELTRIPLVAEIEISRQLLGKFLGETFVEITKKGKRLREDLYYRIKRDAEIKLDNLSERRGDLPLLFKYYIEKAIKDRKNISPANIEIDIQIYKELLDPLIKWKGNVRELQALVNEIISCQVIIDKYRSVVNDELLSIYYYDIKSIIERHRDILK